MNGWGFGIFVLLVAIWLRLVMTCELLKAILEKL